MGYSLRLLPKADADYHEAIEWYKARSADTAMLFIKEVSDVLKLLENNPDRYSYHIEPYRRVLLKSFPYKMVYKIEEDKVLIYALYHTARNEDELRKRLP